MSVRNGLARELRTAVAILVAALSAGLASTAIAFALPGREHIGPAAAPLIVALVAALSLPVLLTFGLVWHAYALDRGWRSSTRYAAAGAMAGLALGALVGLAAMDLILYALFAPIVGAISAMAFWLIRRPDRDAPNPPTPSP